MDRFRGYWWSPDGDAIAVSPSRHRAGAALVHRRSGRPGSAEPTESPTRPPAPTTPTSACTSSRSTAASRRRRVGPCTRSRTSPTSTGPPTGLIATVQSRDQRSIEVLAIDPTIRRATSCCSSITTTPGSSWCPALPASLPTDGSSRAPTGTVPAGCSSTASRSRRPTCRCAPSRRSTTRRDDHRQPDRRRDGATRVAVDARRARTARRRAGRALRPPAGARSSCVRPRSTSPARHLRALAAGARVVRRDTRRARRTCTCRSSVTAASPPPCCSPPITTAHRSRCSSIRTAARTPRAVVQAHNAYLGSQWFADQGFAVVIVDGRGTPGRGSEHGNAPSTAISPAPCSRTRSRPLPGRRRARGPRPRPGRRSAAGASVATSPRSPCSGVRTSSTPPSPARRSPSGACTTRSTPSAISAIPAEHRRRLRRQLVAPAGRPAEPAAAADPRPRRRQRGGRAHAAAVVGAAGGRQAARGAAARRA